MGLGLFRGSFCSNESDFQQIKPQRRAKEPTLILQELVLGNPNPNNFEITRLEKVLRFVVVMIKYPDCKNYEGNKILVFEGVPTKTILNQKSIDPHFCNSKTHPSPVARFEPTEKGWGYAVNFCQTA